jgi:hypothetical protein
MELRQVALVSETNNASFSEVSRVSAALQKQAIRDLGPIWEVQATVDAFAKLEDVPLGYWPIMIRDDIGISGAAGIHEDKDGQPFALVQFDDGWSLTASHELIEMLVDPFGNRLIAGQSPKPRQGRVEFLVEPCDPSEATEFAYTVNGITVSDFYTPKFFSRVADPGAQYSYTGAIKKPLQVLKGGYLSWHDPKTDHWFQEIFFSGNKPTFRDLGKLTANAGKSIRRQLYDNTLEAFAARRPKGTGLRALTAIVTSAEESTSARADSLRKQVDEIIRASS